MVLAGQRKGANDLLKLKTLLYGNGKGVSQYIHLGFFFYQIGSDYVLFGTDTFGHVVQSPIVHAFHHIPSRLI